MKPKGCLFLSLRGELRPGRTGEINFVSKASTRDGNDIDDTQCAELLERFANAHQAFSAFFRFRRDVQRNESGSKIGQGEINILEYKGSYQ